MRILYGTSITSIDITERCLTTLTYGDYILIPPGDDIRAELFGDPAPYILKRIFFVTEYWNHDYDHRVMLRVSYEKQAIEVITREEIDRELKSLHSGLFFDHGVLWDEVPEQQMVLRYLHGRESVLELGSNIGRNTLVIAKKLDDDRRLVTMECDPHTAELLDHNRRRNGMRFQIETAALSARPLAQQGWCTQVVTDGVIPSGYVPVNTMTWDDIRRKYQQIPFDTMVVDCEGGFYFILRDMPECLEGIQLIIMENDYTDIGDKYEVDRILRERGFITVYREVGGWGPCYDRFYEVWKKSAVASSNPSIAAT